MDKQVDGVRNEIHTVLIELEEYIQNLADLTFNVFPEFAIQYPKLSLHSIKVGVGVSVHEYE